jgi:biopolymer transport protein ExbB
MEDEGRRRADNLWQRLSYLADIAAISPMVGLLGTVLGMIQAFNVIAFQTGAVKPILLASGISKAMVTTAAGLIIAIPAMIFHSFFKGRIQDVIARLENISVELYHLLTEKKG